MFYSNEKLYPYYDIKRYYLSNKEIFVIPDDMKQFCTITQSLLEKMNRGEPLSIVERQEFDFTDAKICATRMFSKFFLTEEDTEEIYRNRPTETLFPRLLTNDPHYQEAVKAKEEMEAFLESLNALDVKPNTYRP